MKNFGTLVALLAVSASYVVSLPHEGNAQRGAPDERLSLFARAAKQGKGQAAAQAANNATALAVNGTASANNGTANAGKGKGQGAAALLANGTATANNGTASAGKGKGKGKGKAGNNGQGGIDQLIADVEGQLGIDLNGDGKAGAAAAGGQVNVADLLKLVGARDEEQAEANLAKRQNGKGKGKGRGKGKGKGKANATSAASSSAASTSAAAATATATAAAVEAAV